ncbi:hypothetical protein AJ78_00233 [Emergomyces pasteurianus Ep9510]|uniref:Uncharacterized protein n=1 Tax=Emergomyces pasteurianus Ep9510 TaxID=1447872 RepID=A0A1J9PTZ2_9EURO|nr:hypothetical protein AJ78_00233 [Emergomyces pasteurianus Ep9510]
MQLCQQVKRTGQRHLKEQLKFSGDLVPLGFNSEGYEQRRAAKVADNGHGILGQALHEPITTNEGWRHYNMPANTLWSNAFTLKGTLGITVEVRPNLLLMKRGDIRGHPEWIDSYANWVRNCENPRTEPILVACSDSENSHQVLGMMELHSTPNHDFLVHIH